MKKIATILIVLGLLIACVPVVFADDSDPTTGEITITGAAAHVATTAFVLDGHTLDGTDLGNANHLLADFTPTGISGGPYDGLNASWVVTDPRGTGAGWNIDVVATDFTAVSGPGSLETPAATIPLEGVDKHAGEYLLPDNYLKAEITQAQDLVKVWAPTTSTRSLSYSYRLKHTQDDTPPQLH